MDLKHKISEVFRYIVTALAEGEQPTLDLPDLTSSSAESWCPQRFLFDYSHAATKPHRLMENPYHMHKLLLLLKTLDENVGYKLNKRAVYYKLVS